MQKETRKGKRVSEAGEEVSERVGRIPGGSGFTEKNGERSEIVKAKGR